MADERRRPDDAKVEPLFAALQEKRPPRADPSLRWKLFCAALVFLALLVLVLEQAF